MNKTFSSIAILAATIAGAAHAEQINIDFGRENAVPASTFGAAAGQAGQWNEIDALGRTGHLEDISGARTDVSLRLRADNIDGAAAAPDTDLGLLVGDNFFSQSSWSVRVAGLDAGQYDLYFYAATNAFVPTGDFKVNGQAVESFGSASGTTLVQGVDYQVLKGVEVVDGVLRIKSTDVQGFGGLSGMQIVSSPVPEPGSAPLAAAGLAVLAFVARRKRHAPDA